MTVRGGGTSRNEERHVLNGAPPVTLMGRKRRAAEATRKFIEARQHREIGKELEELGHSGTFENVRAESLESEAHQLLKPAGEIVRGGGEAIDLDRSASTAEQNWNLVETLRHPESVSLTASRERLDLLADADVLAAALDAAKSVQAANSLEKMLAHQMAASHRAAIKLLARGLDDRLPPVEAARLTNAAARMMQVYQEAFLTLQKIRTGGKQTVVVQHVQVSDGGQAVVAANLKSDSRGHIAGEGSRNGRSTP